MTTTSSYSIKLFRQNSADPLADLQGSLIFLQAEAAAREMNEAGEAGKYPIAIEHSSAGGQSRLVLSATVPEPLNTVRDDAMLRFGLELPEVEEEHNPQEAETP